MLLFLVAVFGPSASLLFAQTTDQGSVSAQIRRLTDAMEQEQAQLEQSQHQLDEMRTQLHALQSQLTQGGANAEPPAVSGAEATSSSSSQAAAAPLAAAVQEIRERQAMLETQIATHEQSKVESESRYPVKVTGLILLNGFVNTGAVDMPATPTVALPGYGSTGASLRQTVLGIDARGPHVFGARSYADLRVDFDGSSASGSAATTYTGYYSTGTTLLRLRTAHAGLQWQNTDLAFALDRPLISPETPTSLTAVAVPALAWSGNLWTWNPQVELTRDLDGSSSRRIRLQTAVIDVSDAPLSPVASAGLLVAPLTTAEQSRWPGVEARAALLGSAPNDRDEGSHFGIGGYFAPHDSTFLGRRFDSWAGTLDARLRLPARLAFSGSFYRGQALGGLGGGAYKDFVYRIDPDGNGYYSRILDDVGGWAQLKERFSERLEMNAAFGIDNAFAGELRPYTVPDGTTYQNLARDRSYTGNVIYSPNAYLMFSLDYRHLVSSTVVGLPSESDIVGLGAGYRF